MKTKKFIQSYRCECFQPINYCSCSQRVTASKTLIENVTDIAESLVEIMILCGIYSMRAKSSFDIILYYFLNFEEIMHRINSIPRKRLNKEDLMHDLSCKCRMNRVEAQMAYSIIKRAFKAFYYGTGIGGIPNHFLSDQLTHTSECLWVHAAQRTAQIYAAYEGILYASQKDLECQIKLIYKQLYDRMCNRTSLNDDPECTCKICFKRINKESLKPVKVTTRMHNLDDPYEVIYTQEQNEFMKKQQEKTEEDWDKNQSLDNTVENIIKRCSCPSLYLSENDYAYREIAEAIDTCTSQGPFDCRWFPISKEEYEEDDADIQIKLPEESPCPPCSIDEECESSCECTCEDCTCDSDMHIYSGEQVEDENQNLLEENMGEEEIDVEIEIESQLIIE